MFVTDKLGNYKELEKIVLYNLSNSKFLSLSKFWFLEPYSC